MNSERKRGRPTKTATPGEKKIKVSLVLPAETKNDLDAGREQGRTQAEEAARLIGLGRLFEQFGRFTLPPEMQSQAVELYAAHSGGAWAEINYLMTCGSPDEAERWHRWHNYYLALLSYRANHHIHEPSEKGEESPKAEAQQPADPPPEDRGEAAD